MNCIIEEKYLKINYDSKNDLYYWELEKYLNRKLMKIQCSSMTDQTNL